jgi:hypothetical protein
LEGPETAGLKRISNDKKRLYTCTKEAVMKLGYQKRAIVSASVWLISAILAHQVTAEVTFTQVTEGELATDVGRSFGVAWGDYDGDGWVDLVVTDATANRLYHNDGDGSFTKVTSGAIVEDSPADGWATWADYNNDGDLDLFMSSFNTPDRFYENQGDGSFLRIPDGEIVPPGENRKGNSAAFGDLDNDGFVDLFVANTSFQINCLYMNNGDGTMTWADMGGNVVSHLSQWSDYDNDGDMDLLVAQQGDSTSDSLFYQNEDGVLIRGDGDPINRGTWQDIDIASADYDNDGDLDLVVAGYLGDRLYLNDGAGNFTEVLDDVIQNAPEGPSACAAWGDYDNDGLLDLFIARSNLDGVDYPDLLYHNEGNGEFSAVTDIPLVTRIGYSWSAAWADYDNDGDLDLVVSDGFDAFAGRPCALYRNDGGNENNWLQVSLQGTISNASAIGAKVHIKHARCGYLGMREITGHNGDLRAHFGLGFATKANVQIFWPSGCDQTLTGIAANQILTIREIPWPHPTVDKHCYTGDWMGWLQVENAPWAWCLDTQCWFYIPYNVAESGSGWIYIHNLAENNAALGIKMFGETNWGYSHELNKFLYVYPDGSGWAYLLG